MPSIKIAKSTVLSPQECYNRVTKMFETDKDLQKLDPKYKCEFDAKSLSGNADGSQFKAKMLVKPDKNGAQLTVDVELPFHLALVKGMVQKTLEKKLDQALS